MESKSEIIQLKLSGRSYYKLDGYFYFELDTDDVLKLSYEDCLEVFLTLGDNAGMADRDAKYLELADRLGVTV